MQIFFSKSLNSILKEQCRYFFIFACVIFADVLRMVTRYFVCLHCQNAILFCFFKTHVNNYSKAWTKAHKIVILKSTFLSSAMICWTQYANLFFSDNATENYQIGLRFNNSWRSTFCKWQSIKLNSYNNIIYLVKLFTWWAQIV